MGCPEPERPTPKADAFRPSPEGIFTTLCRGVSVAHNSFMLELQTPVKFIKGVGPRRAEDLASKNIFTVEDLLYNLPYRYEDRTHFQKVKHLQPGVRASILVQVLTAGLMITRKSRLRIFDLAARDESGIVRCKWFHSEYLAQKKNFPNGPKGHLLRQV